MAPLYAQIHPRSKVLSADSKPPISLCTLSQQVCSIRSTISKDDSHPSLGIQLPDDLVLIHEQTDHYSLQAANLEMGGLHSNMEAAVSNGATFMPNTFTMQEFIRMSLDEHLEKIEGGKFSSEPVIYSVRKGWADLA